MKYTVTKDGVEIASYDILSFCINTITNDKSFMDNLYEITNTDGKVVWSTKNSKV